MMTSLLAAAEEGNVDAISELMESSSAHFDVNLANRVRLLVTAHIAQCHLCEEERKSEIKRLAFLDED